MRQLRLSVGAGLLILLLALGSYGIAGLVGGMIATNSGSMRPADGIPVIVESNGVHTGLVLPKVAAGVDWRGVLPAGDLADPRYAAYDHVAIGWGDRKFYVETPTWADVRPMTVLWAALGSGQTVMHVEHIAPPQAGADSRVVLLRPEEYRRLAAFIRASFAPRGWHRTGYGMDDAFYAAVGHYDAIHTCNDWTGDALRAAGVRIGAWTPFAMTVLEWFPA
ncbi:uncharacterized protein (TIGR02117 family) [Sphingomonas sp. PvP055]|uniref:TIGR02117 family protein n=1 Tax=Sphingomonas sp. PvP055 TaxID=3156391 RepID=UPI00339B5EBC